MIENTTNPSVELIANKLDSYIQVLAEKLGVAAEYVYPLFVKQQVIEGWWFFVTASVFFILSISLLVPALIKGFKNKWKDDWCGWCVMAGSAGLFIALVVLCAEGAEHFTKIINPEYAAIREIVELAK